MPKYMNACKVITGPNTLWSYVHVWTPTSINGSAEKYSISLVFDKETEKETIEKIKAAIEAAYHEGEAKLKGNSKTLPPLETLKTPLRDGDLEKPDDENYRGCMFLNANSTTMPGIIDKDRNEIIDHAEVYSGCRGRASIQFYAYNTGTARGVACGLSNLMKCKDGKPLGGHTSAVDDFADCDDDDDDFLS